MFLIVISGSLAVNDTTKEYWDIVSNTLDMNIQQPLMREISRFTVVDKNFEEQYLSIFDNLRNDLITSLTLDGGQQYLNKENAEKNIQLGIEEVFHEAETEMILSNTNLMWSYVILLFQLIGDLLLTLFYFLQFLLLIYVMFVFIPKTFLMLRDGLTGIIVKMQRRKYKR